MTTNGRVHRGRKAVAAVAAAGAVTGGAMWMAGGASAETDLDAGWPVAASAQSAARAASARGHFDLVVRTVEVRSAAVDVGPRGESTGDFFHFEEQAFKPGTNRMIGRDAVRCELGIRTFQCNATLRINGKGKIVVDGAIFRESDFTLPITGGTGRFAGVGGTLHVLEGAGGSTRLAFDFVR